MSPNWIWCLAIGVLVVVVDLASLAVVRGQPPQSELAQLVFIGHLVANFVLFAYVGARTARATGRVTAAAEAGVVASLPPAMAAVAMALLETGAAAGPDAPSLADAIVGGLALNVALGGLTAWLAGLMLSRGRSPVR